MKKFEFGIEDPSGKKTNEEEISIASNFTVAIKDKYSMIFPDNHVANFYRVIFRSMAVITKHFKSTKTPRIGFSLLNDRGEFRLGALLVYRAPEGDDEENTGSWNLSFTFDKEDLSDLDKAIDSHNDAFVRIAEAEVYSAMFGHFTDPTSMARMFDQAIESIVNFLDVNSNDGEDVELTLPGIFTASCGFEDGAKVYSIVPGAVIKQLIKDDDGLSTSR